MTKENIQNAFQYSYDFVLFPSNYNVLTIIIIII